MNSSFLILSYLTIMFEKIKHTKYAPKKTMLVWDGDCGFCKYWKTRWQIKTGNTIDFIPYQKIAKKFKDIPIKEFKKASRLIEPDGKVYNGPDSAFRSLWHEDMIYWHKLYQSNRLFRNLADYAYNHIAKHRSFYFIISKILWGKNPKTPRAYWLIYILIIFLVLILGFSFA